nr:hypothetical protein [Pseudogemmobacter bohemicus]
MPDAENRARNGREWREMRRDQCGTRAGILHPHLDGNGLLLATSSRNSRAITPPIRKPSPLCSTTTRRISRPEVAICVFGTTTTAATIRTIPVTGTSGSTGTAAFSAAGIGFCARLPCATGKITSFTIERNIAIASTGRYWLANIQTSQGVTSGTSTVVTGVQAPLSTASSLARQIITFDELPPRAATDQDQARSHFRIITVSATASNGIARSRQSRPPRRGAALRGNHPAGSGPCRT